MTPIGERVGAAMTRSRKLWVVAAVGFLMGFIVTVSEPDLQVLAEAGAPACPTPSSSGRWLLAWASFWWSPCCASCSGSP